VTRGTVAGAAVAIAVLSAVALGYRALVRDIRPPVATRLETAPVAPAVTHPPAASHQGFLYGRVTTVDGVAYEGRLRWGGDEEAFWDDSFHGFKRENPWFAHVPPERRPTERRPLVLFGLQIAERKRPIDLGRPFAARFGDIARIEASGDEVRVALKSGSEFELARFDASDFDDGLRVWDAGHGVVDLDSLRIRSVELLPTPALGAAPYRPYGTVRTRQGDFTGFVAWNRFEAVGTDELDGRPGLRLDSLRSIARRSRSSSLVTLLDGLEIALDDTAEVGDGNAGVYVDDRRYGRLLISWDEFERVDFEPSTGSGQSYGDFPPGRPLAGRVATRDGRHFAGRLVYDLDEGETTETLDAPCRGVNYSIPFGRIASIAPQGDDENVRVTLFDGEALRLERAGDLGPGNAGLLVFVDGRPRPEYVPWPEIARVDLDRPPAEIGAPAPPLRESPPGAHEPPGDRSEVDHSR